MRHGTLIGLAGALAACGVATTVTNDAADAQQRRGKSQPRPRANNVRVPNFDYPGGMAGCFDPRLSGYPRAAAERAGGVPCATPRRTTTNSPASRGATWIVGEWGPGGDMCSLNGPTLEAGGVYYGMDGRGRWSLAGNTLTLVVTHVSDDGGDSEYPLRQPRRMTVRVSPLPDGRMRWQEGNTPARVFLRCRQIQMR